MGDLRTRTGGAAHCERRAEDEGERFAAGVARECRDAVSATIVSVDHRSFLRLLLPLNYPFTVTLVQIRKALSPLV